MIKTDLNCTFEAFCSLLDNSSGANSVSSNLPNCSTAVVKGKDFSSSFFGYKIILESYEQNRVLKVSTRLVSKTVPVYSSSIM